MTDDLYTGLALEAISPMSAGDGVADAVGGVAEGLFASEPSARAHPAGCAASRDYATMEPGLTARCVAVRPAKEHP